MPHYLEFEEEGLQREPLILIIPGDRPPGTGHWQSLWAAQCSDCQRVDFETWDNPRRNDWVNRLNMAIYRADRPVILVAQGLGCVAVAWWAEYEQPPYANPVVGALFTDAPDVDRPGSDPRLANFGSCPRKPLPFPAFLTAGQGDRFANLRTAQMLAGDWGCRFIYAGETARSDAGAGDWHFGKKLLSQLLQEHRSECDGLRRTRLSRGSHLGDGITGQARDCSWPRRA